MSQWHSPEMQAWEVACTLSRIANMTADPRDRVTPHDFMKLAEAVVRGRQAKVKK